MEMSQMEKSLLRLIRFSTIHCDRFRGRAFDDRAVPDRELAKIASAMLDLFEKEMEKAMWKRPSTPDPKGGGKSPKIRF